MTNRERFFAGHRFEFDNRIAWYKSMYQEGWLMVDDIQMYFVPDADTDKSFTYERLYTPFDSTDTMQFEALKFINDEKA